LACSTPKYLVNNRNNSVNIHNLINIPCTDFETFSIPTIVSCNRRNNPVVRRQHYNVNNIRPIKTIDEPHKQQKGKKVLVATMNCQSACNKAILLREHIQDMGYDFVGLTETWLSPEDAHAGTIATLSSDGYKLYHRPRRNENGGGVALVCRDSYNIKLLPEHNFSSFEVIEVSTTIVSITLRIIVLYRVSPHHKNKI